MVFQNGEWERWEKIEGTFFPTRSSDFLGFVYRFPFLLLFTCSLVLTIWFRPIRSKAFPITVLMIEICLISSCLLLSLLCIMFFVSFFHQPFSMMGHQYMP